MNYKCYIVDDEMHGINLVSDYIKESHDLEIVGSANDPRLALNQINLLKPDIVFTDINMPYISGVELAKKIMDFAFVVFVSADRPYSHPEIDLEKNIFLTKPIRLQKFLDAVSEIKSRLNRKTTY
ncbi:hypothetical protein DHW03_19040 [Pedobacter yonginense]|uniref:Response regulatory domain-containing protein n=1 Tax=Pedobacter yonginense TaxID=651869 RepID=A0A317EGJ0_9SPHI|nr:response regulator [Pedobacter yonginense]PWS25930.1 hypothetical protein DHW03_19040 [Pedobacter yonginense]